MHDKCAGRRLNYSVINTTDSIYTEPLTRREREVAHAVARGLGNRDIARELGIAPETVKHHLSNVYGKLGVSGRLALAVRVLQGGVDGDTQAA